MSIPVSVEVNTVEFEAAMQRLKQAVRDGFVSAQYGTLPVQARLLSERCQDFTPPRSIGQGKAAVANDLTRIFRPLDQKTFTDKSLKRIIRTDNRPAWDKVAQNLRGTHNLQNTKAIGFSTDWHARNRNRRGKGVSPRKSNLGVVTLGPEGRKARQYMALIKKRVGWAKAGWNAGIIGFGGTVKSPWINRHGLGHGSFVDATMSDDPYVKVTNSTSWAKHYGEGRRILRNAISARARDMEHYAWRMANLAKKKAGF